MALSLSVIIVHYQVPYFLEHCLYSLLSVDNNMDKVQIIVVDNATFLPNNVLMEEKFPEVQFIYLKENVGFGKANNEALKYVSSDLVLFLNPDTIITENVLTSCIRQFELDASIGGLGVKMLDGNGCFLSESKRSIPTFSVSLMKLTGLSTIFPSSAFFNKYALGNVSKDSDCFIDVIAGAFFMARTTVVKSIGGFDPQFFMYGEDIDLSQQIILKGYCNYYLGTQSILHFKGESTKQNKSKHVKVFYEAMILYVAKYYRNWNKLLFKSFLNGAVKGRALFERLGNKVANTNSFHPKTICFMGDSSIFESAESILKKNIEGFEIIDQQKLDGADTVLFCVGKNWSYSQALMFMQKNKTRYQYLFYKKSCAIIGSNNKKETGIQWD
ncbi:glycosyltransferase family 2 protein [Rhizosphaericola mali]|uniref:Glycosyltransferase family 2 protein n=1 Tax=Rhizosphaericola mali TaxID=2545455 RepID=A0A5P2G880_9BACT|nr:glycosyltransferase family 2 protein [Rhizosphaericola mali]QES89960.1 glycosyltransferase family 2 protein [Rhizosphaericola mali]